MRIVPATLLGLLSTTATARSIHLSYPGQTPLEHNRITTDVCPLAPKVSPPNDGLHASTEFVKDDAIRKRQVERLSKAVQVPSTSTEAHTDPYDPYYDTFLKLHDVLESLFPLTHSYAKVEKVNRLGLLFTLNGTNDAVKPLLLTAHQDVVPIDDASDWTYPPFAGHFDGEWLWGRGAGDCKNVLIGLLSAVEDLLQQGWTPTRTVILAFGFDEESKGWNGAGHLNQVLEKRYGLDSFEFLLDEGDMGLQTVGEVVYASPGVGEKGSINLHLALSIAGGHSSVPPAHTGIGIIAEIIYHLEREDLFVPKLDQQHPFRKVLECQTQHSPDYVEPWLVHALQSDDYIGLAEAVASSRGDNIRFTLQTSQAVDLIRGGVKINALPEKVNATINYRVALHENTDIVKARAINIITPLVQKYNLTFNAFGSGHAGNGYNHLELITPNNPLEPAPISPTDVREDAVWAHFSGVARSVFESLPSFAGKKVAVSGDVMTGNTDTRFYWGLTRNIYRWSPSRAGRTANIHTVDERLDIAVHLEGLAWYYDLIRSFDTWES